MTLGEQWLSLSESWPGLLSLLFFFQYAVKLLVNSIFCHGNIYLITREILPYIYYGVDLFGTFFVHDENYSRLAETVKEECGNS